MKSPGYMSHDELDPVTLAVYREALTVLNRAGMPFLVGGAYAFGCYTGILRHTKDFDIFVRHGDVDRVLATLQAAGFMTELTFPHWLAKAFSGEDFLDIIFSGGNGVAQVDEGWFEHAIDDELWDIPVRLCPPEEIIWSKSFVMERERFDGADIAHILHARGPTLDWERLLDRFGPHWRVLLTHLLLFGFIYPAERSKVPARVLELLLARLGGELHTDSPEVRLCRGTLLSRAQYLIDIDRWGYHDARLRPRGNLTREQIVHWTAAIGK